jgi:hypothetical protein
MKMARSLPNKSSIAVLPFINMSADTGAATGAFDRRRAANATRRPGNQ